MWSKCGLENKDAFPAMKSWSRMWKSLLGIIVLLLVYRFATVSTLEPVAYFSGKLPYVIAHQGGDGLRPGNTMHAFENAMALGVDVLEMDVHASLDGELVLIHDTTLDRTTNGSGYVKDLTLSELKALDAGYYWPYDKPGKHPFRNSGVQIALLSEVLESFPDTRYIIEIKQFQPSVVKPLCQILESYNVLNTALVASTDADTMLAFRKQCPGVATSSFSSEITWFLAYHYTGLIALYQGVSNAFQVPTHFNGLELIDEKFIAHARQRGVHVDAWTINTVETMQRLLDAGVSGIITDYPDRLVGLMNQNQEDQ